MEGKSTAARITYGMLQILDRLEWLISTRNTDRESGGFQLVQEAQVVYIIQSEQGCFTQCTFIYAGANSPTLFVACTFSLHRQTVILIFIFNFSISENCNSNISTQGFQPTFSIKVFLEILVQQLSNPQRLIYSVAQQYVAQQVVEKISVVNSADCLKSYFLRERRPVGFINSLCLCNARC